MNHSSKAVRTENREDGNLRVRVQSFHPIALLVSALAHLALAMGLGHRPGSGTTSTFNLSPSLIVSATLLPTVMPAGDYNAPANRRRRNVDNNIVHPTSNAYTRSQRGFEEVTTITSSHAEVVEPKMKDAIGLPLLPPTEPHYFRISELTRKPSVRHDVPADIVAVVPDVLPGPIALELLISSQGEVDSVVIHNTLLSEDAKRLIRESFAAMKFHPATIGAMPVPCRMRIEVTLKNAASVSVTQVH